LAGVTKIRNFSEIALKFLRVPAEVLGAMIEAIAADTRCRDPASYVAIVREDFHETASTSKRASARQTGDTCADDGNLVCHLVSL
jgi:hypothetical protein